MGDRAVIHGSGGRGFIGVVEVVSDHPEPNTEGNEQDQLRWPWVLHYRLLIAIRADDHAPGLELVGWDNPKRLRRQSHVSIDRSMYERVTEAIVEGAAQAVAV